MKGTWRIIAVLLLFWLAVVLYMSTTLFQSGDLGERAEKQLQQALKELDALKHQNDELFKLAGEIRDLKTSSGKGHLLALKKLQEKLKKVTEELEKAEHNKATVILQSDVPDIRAGASVLGTRHEKLRRKINNGVKEMWYYLSSELKKLKIGAIKDPVRLSRQIDNALENGAEHHRVILSDLGVLSESDGAKEWREKEAKDLMDYINKRFKQLQNPKDCKTAKKVVCNLNKGCGFGCQIHHVAYCMIIAYGTGRTLVLDSRGWRYSHGGWEKVFKPLSDTCLDKSGTSSRAWGAKEVIENIQVVELPIVDSLHPRPAFMPLSVPEDIAPRLTRLHGNPIVWWIGQVCRFLMRPQPRLQKDLDSIREKLGFKNPIVGVHVRRTDKVGTEAAFHKVEEYMLHVEEFYRKYELTKPVDKRRVYLASDDPSVLPDAKQKYPNYEFIGDIEISKTAGLSSRYSDASLHGIIVDIYLLSLSDFLVCTFSSQVCRLAYELMQTYHPDAHDWFRSLDDIFYYGGQNGHDQRVIYPHQPKVFGELELKLGDLIGIAGNHWDGYSKGTNKRTGKVGLFPSFKVEDRVESVKMATFPELDEEEEEKTR
ncbi:alpha-(1,6)-fucosyltransferase-like isoform X2 [Lineus longissimus]|uniref:alpha-(1,6)-fucosyltransferase-like isoform X2 n=1 Tax=Lineus longissimus TaxID=88925 RepID=UPI002B4DB844